MANDKKAPSPTARGGRRTTERTGNLEFHARSQLQAPPVGQVRLAGAFAEAAAGDAGGRTLPAHVVDHVDSFHRELHRHILSDVYRLDQRTVDIEDPRS